MRLRSLLAGWFVLAIGLVGTVLQPSPASAQSTDSTSRAEASSGKTESSSTGETATSKHDASSSDDGPSCPETTGGSLEPKRLIVLGVQCFKAERYSQAYTYYTRARRQTSTPALTAALGRSLHKLGFYHAAREKYEIFLEEAGSDSDGARKIRKRIEQLDEDVAANGVDTTMTSFPPDARVFVELDNGDWAEVGRTPFTGVLEQGSYRIAVEKPRYRRLTREVRLSSESSGASSSDTGRTLEFQLVSEASSFDASARQWKRAGWITGLSSVAVLGAGLGFFGATWGKFDEVDDYVRTADTYVPATQNRLVDQAHDYQRAALILTAVGGTGVATGLVLWIRGHTLRATPTSDDDSSSTSETAKTATVRPFVGLRSLGVRASW
jgi:tetratricopeptide (TPR) repeat protein